MTARRAVRIISAVVVLVVLACGGVTVTLFFSAFDQRDAAQAHCPAGVEAAPAVSASASGAGFGEWNGQQVAHATTIVAAGKKANMAPRGWVIAVATAMQESTLRNLANTNVPRSMTISHEDAAHDHDSVGLFQQRPLPPDGRGSWGTVEELMTPATSAGKFYAALRRVSGWQTMELTQAAQAVQNSGFPDAYAKWESKANALVAHVAGVADIGAIGGGAPGAECGGQAGGDGSTISASGWTAPVKAKVGAPWGESRAGQGNSAPHRHAGVDLMAARNTPILAAAAGTVVVVKCNAPEWHGCDTDGHPGLGGCGWYVEIAHAGNIHTRYCHMVRKPLVSVGDPVTVGQLLGNVGSSGNSSGPHLHFEVHLGLAPTKIGSFESSTDPVPFMRDRGAPLGS